MVSSGRRNRRDLPLANPQHTFFQLSVLVQTSEEIGVYQFLKYKLKERCLTKWKSCNEVNELASFLMETRGSGLSP